MVELVAVGVVLVALALLLDCVSRELVPVEPEERLDPGLAVLTGVLSLAYPTVGALIASRLPKRGGAPVTMWVEGREYQGTADAITDHAEVTRVLGRFLEAQPGYGKYVGLKSGPEGRMNPAEVKAVARERVVVRARPTQG